MAPCAIRGYVLLTRMEIAAEDVPAGSGILTSLDERRRVVSGGGITFPSPFGEIDLTLVLI